jgi:hypothetical protein
MSQPSFRAEVGDSLLCRLALIVSNCEQTRQMPFVHTGGKMVLRDHCCAYTGIPPN